MNSIEKLTQIFSRFPGIGPRQARRFVYHLLTRAETLEELSKNLKDLREDVAICPDCQRFFQKNGNGKLCKICADKNRDRSLLMLVQRDADLESIEKNGGFSGIYFVLGGSVPILEKEPEKKIRIKELREYLSRLITGSYLKEIILGVNWNPEGENTADYIAKEIKQITNTHKIKITHLGKGLSMGTELEYADSDTLKNALRNRN